MLMLPPAYNNQLVQPQGWALLVAQAAVLQPGHVLTHNLLCLDKSRSEASEALRDRQSEAKTWKLLACENSWIRKAKSEVGNRVKCFEFLMQQKSSTGCLTPMQCHLGLLLPPRAELCAGPDPLHFTVTWQQKQGFPLGQRNLPQLQSKKLPAGQGILKLQGGVYEKQKRTCGSWKTTVSPVWMIAR